MTIGRSDNSNRRESARHVGNRSLYELLTVLLCLVFVGFASDEKGPAIELQDKAPEPCQLCHEFEDCQWRLSRHSQAMGSSFMEEWKLKGKDQKCLECHTKTVDEDKGHYSGKGVSCELCHGSDNPDHPKQEKKMAIPVTSDVCRDCHCVTWGQWRVSGHGRNDVQCFDCHKMHQVMVPEEDPDKLCGTCHQERLSEFIKTKHSSEELKCVTCHMPDPVGIDTECQGKNVPGHSFSIDAWPCTGCHSGMVHTNSGSPS